MVAALDLQGFRLFWVAGCCGSGVPRGMSVRVSWGVRLFRVWFGSVFGVD